MQTKRLAAGRPEALAEAAEMLKQGSLVAFPTDTLYGLGAHAFQAEAIRLLYMAKNRPRDKGIPILLADMEDLDRVAGPISEVAARLAAEFWPGPLTLILPRKEILPDLISPDQTIAVRIPDHDLCRRFIRAAGGAVAASSANRSGEAPAQTADEVLAALTGTIAAVLDGGPVVHGRASTIFDCTVSPAQLLRPGPISGERLARLLPKPS